MEVPNSGKEVRVAFGKDVGHAVLIPEDVHGRFQAREGEALVPL